MIRRDSIFVFGVLAFVVSIVAISGCTSTASNNNYTNGHISFEYPSDFQNTTYPGDLVSGDNAWTNIKFLANDQSTDILVAKNSNVTGMNQEDIGKASALNFENGGWTILGSARFTNPNGVEMWKVTSTATDPTMNTDRYYETVDFMQGWIKST